MNEIETFIAKYLMELREDNAAAFIGAGLSKAAGYVDWPGLIAPLAIELGLDPSQERDLVGVAQFYVNAHSNNRQQLNQQVFDAFSDLRSPTENHEILARLPIATFWTTNYDRLLETALEDGGKRVDAKYAKAQLATTKRGRDVVLFKMHGDIEHPSEAILTRDDYEKYYLTHAPFVTALSGDLVEKTFLFIGFSFSDPNLDYVLSRVRINFAQNQRQHYCIAKRRTRLKGERDEEFQYAVTKQMLTVQDLMRFNIKTVFVDDYAEITGVLRALERRFRMRTVFVSGSAVEYGAWGREATEEFLRLLSAALIKKDLRITTGFGLGVGGAVVTGAVQEIYSTTTRAVSEQLVMRPFPRGIVDDVRRKQTYARYREELVGQAGIALFLLGNKTGVAGTELASGVRAEFELARDRGLFLVPIGATGFMAQQLWTEVMVNFDKYYPGARGAAAKPLMEVLGKAVASPNELLDPILKLIELLSRE